MELHQQTGALMLYENSIIGFHTVLIQNDSLTTRHARSMWWLGNMLQSVEERSSTRDSSGQETTTVTRSVGDQKYTTTTKRSQDGHVETTENFENIDGGTLLRQADCGSDTNECRVSILL